MNLDFKLKFTINNNLLYIFLSLSEITKTHKFNLKKNTFNLKLIKSTLNYK